MRLGPVVAFGLVGCKFSPPAPVEGDAAPPDAGPCMAAPTRECADDITLRECITAGQQPVDKTCPWGCITGGDAHCGIVNPYGGGATPADTDPATFGALGNVTLTAPTTIDGSAGTITGLTTEFEFLPRPNNIAVFRFKSLTIGAPVRLAGTAAIVLVVDGQIIVNALVDAKGPCSFDDDASTPGPGGFAGGLTATSDGQGPGGGKVGSGKAGGGGGGHGGMGGPGGIGPLAAPGGAGGVPNGSEMIELLVGGSGGGATDGNGGRARGGGGGGAIQLVSNMRIVLGPGGAIDAGGCGGDSGAGGGEDGGGGGGAGGTILLEAPVIEGAGRLAVNGGGGGAGDDSGLDTRPTAFGEAGRLDRAAAEGAVGSLTGSGGGRGAAGASFNGEPGILSATHAGGGGGAVGRIRLVTRLGTADTTGEMSPGLGDPGSTCTAGPARVQ